jgi:heme/copper-type cytochrome/quinol oxidase subunit 2
MLNLLKQSFLLMYFTNSCLDIPRPGQLLFQDPATRFLEFAITFHHDVMLIMLCFFCLVLWFIIRINFVFKSYISWKDLLPGTSFVGKYIYMISRWNKEFLPNTRSIHLRKNISYKSHNMILEIVWTLVPALILVSIAIPSFNLLYFNQWDTNATYTVRVTASQWYWTYTYPLHYNYNLNSQTIKSGISAVSLNYNKTPWFSVLKPKGLVNKMELANELSHKVKPSWYGEAFYNVNADLLKISSKTIELSFDSTLTPLKLGNQYRLLEVDNKLILPRNTHIKFVVTSNDVLHSWSIPSLGIKIDACPGRLNEVSTVIYRNSVFYGQCSEICGVLHGFMPIVVQTVNYLDFLKLKYLLLIGTQY